MFRKIHILLSLFLCFSSCIDDDNEIQSRPSFRTVLVYMVAENNLYKNAKQDIAEMQVYSERINGNLLVYLDAPADLYYSPKSLIIVKLQKYLRIITKIKQKII